MRQISLGGGAMRAAVLGAVTVTAFLNILSCSDSTGPAANGGPSADSLALDESRIVSVSVTLNPATISVGQTAQASATLLDSRGTVIGRQVNWSSSDSSVATVTATGLVTAHNVGTAQIIASRYRRSASGTLTVVASVSTTPATVASVTVSPATTGLTVGNAQQLTATVRDSGGAVLTDRAVTWVSSNSAVATVSPSGLVSGVATGSVTITATSDGVSGTAAVSVSGTPPLAPPPPSGAPEPAAGDVILWQDGFDGSNPLASYAKRGAMQIISNGHNGSAVRFPYSASSYDNLIEKAFQTTADIYFRYWYRTSPGADPTCGNRGGSGMKWFMAWRASTYVRYTMGVGDLSNGPTGRENLGNEFTAHDNTSTREPNPFLSNVNNGIRLSTTNDGQWHEYTLHIVTSLGDGTGYEQIWIDGTLVLDNSAYRYDHNPEGIAMVQFPGLVVNWFSGCDFSIDVDDLVIWHQ